MERRLAAIVALDMVGYSRLMAADESGVLSRQIDHRNQIIGPVVAAHHGRIVKTTGDGVLAEFGSVVDAVGCAIALQSAISNHQSSVSVDSRIVYRIGINLGDIIIENGDIYGEGVNIAARLQTLADPGGICVSQTVAEHAWGKVACLFKDLGLKHLKNVPQPVRVYSLSAPSAAPTRPGPAARRRMVVLEHARFRLDLENERLWDGESPVHLTHKAFDLLRFLAQNPNRVLTREEILESLWRSIHVSDGLVREYIHDLRLVLDDDPRSPRFIETVRGRGYRFLGGIEIEAPASGTAEPRRRRTDPPTLLVLPIESLVRGKSWARFCRGLRDDLITELSRYPDFVVITRGASLVDQGTDAELHEAGEFHETGADFLLRGSMQASGRTLRMNLHLVDTLQGHNIWSERYERETKDLFAIQSDIVGSVVSALGGLEGQIAEAERRRLGRKPPKDPKAYELYLLALALEERHQKESTLEAFALLQRALSLDPQLARAWLILGWACHQIWSERWTDDPRYYADIESEAYVKAARLDPRDPFAIVEVAAMVRAIDGDLVGARDGLERAVDLGRNQADLLATAAKYFAMVLDDPSRAVQLIERSERLCPTPADWYFMHWARVAYFARDYQKALNAAKRAPDLKTVRLFEILSAAQLGQTDNLGRLRAAFEKRYPAFNLAEFMQSQPIVGTRATALFLDGVAKAGLG
jgi:class 3 adenylate cyclase/TolB-like protein